MKYTYGVLSIISFVVHCWGQDPIFTPTCKVNAVNQQAAHYVGSATPSSGKLQLKLLLLEGLQKEDRVLEIGCGALIAAIPIMSFLEPDHYVGIDPNKWLIEDSLKVLENQAIAKKQYPTFLYNNDFNASSLGIEFDFIISHSIISHAAHWQLPLFLENCAKVLKDDGVVIVSLRLTDPNEYGSCGAEKETQAIDWQYPGNSFFDKDTIVQEASKWFRKVEHKKSYTKLFTDEEPGAFHDWFVLTK